MRFRIWRETLLSRTDARSIVFDAIGAGRADQDQVGVLLGSSIQEHPSLSQKLAGYSQLRDVVDKITAFIEANPSKTLQDLITFIDML